MNPKRPPKKSLDSGISIPDNIFAMVSPKRGPDMKIIEGLASPKNRPSLDGNSPKRAYMSRNSAKISAENNSHKRNTAHKLSANYSSKDGIPSLPVDKPIGRPS